MKIYSVFKVMGYESEIWSFKAICHGAAWQPVCVSCVLPHLHLCVSVDSSSRVTHLRGINSSPTGFTCLVFSAGLLCPVW